ncbi:MAG: MerR family transcriptional regulator [Candidatus Polarisedimenticolia bacterium]
MMKATPEVPNKLFYKIGEVCELTDTQPYVLRFWESEFPQLAPRKNRSGQRVYQRKDIDMVIRIKKLLYDEEYTIAGARKKLDEEGAPVEAAPRAAKAVEKAGQPRVPEMDHPVDLLSSRMAEAAVSRRKGSAERSAPAAAAPPAAAAGRVDALRQTLERLQGELREILDQLRGV